MRHAAALPLLTVALCLVPTTAHAQIELLINGGFETGDLTGWTTESNLSPDTTTAGFFVADSTVFPGDPGGYPLPSPLTPVTFQPTIGPASGSFYAVTDGDGAAANSLFQRFTIPVGATQVSLSFSLFVNARNGAGALNTEGAIDYDQAATQFARVDLLTAAAEPFSLGVGNVVQNFYRGVDPNVGPNPLYPIPYTTYSFDITGIVTPGNTYLLRIADMGNQYIVNTGVDDVSVRALVASVAPEPGAWGLFVLGCGALIVAKRRPD